MRFCHRIALAFLLVYLLEDTVQGAPGRGRYMWLRCRPGSKNANCVQQQGPVIDLHGQNKRLPPSATKDIFPVESVEDTPETEEQSGEGSGGLDAFDQVVKVKRDWMSNDQAVPQVEEQFGEEEGSGVADYSNYVYPKRVETKLPAEDLKNDNMIQ